MVKPRDIKEAVSSMRYENGAMKGMYWFIRVALIAVPTLLVIAVAGVIYCKANGIEIQSLF